MSEMVERVARAIWERRREKYHTDYPDMRQLDEWGDGSVPRANGVEDEARSAIEAMRVPTREAFLCLVLESWPLEWERGKKFQYEHGLDVCGPNTESEVVMGQYQRFIDEALNGGFKSPLKDAGK